MHCMCCASCAKLQRENKREGLVMKKMSSALYSHRDANFEEALLIEEMWFSRSGEDDIIKNE